MIQGYSRRKLTYEEDRLPAITGLAVDFQRHIGGNYLAGLWRPFLLEGLLWQACAVEISTELWISPTVEQKVHDRQPKEYRAPSWSWASQAGAVSYDLLPEGEQSPTIAYFNKVQRILEITDCTTRLANPVSPYGRVTRGLLSVRGLLKHSTPVTLSGLRSWALAQENWPVEGFHTCIFADHLPMWKTRRLF